MLKTTQEETSRRQPAERIDLSNFVSKVEFDVLSKKYRKLLESVETSIVFDSTVHIDKKQYRGLLLEKKTLGSKITNLESRLDGSQIAMRELKYTQLIDNQLNL